MDFLVNCFCGKRWQRTHIGIGIKMPWWRQKGMERFNKANYADDFYYLP